MRRYLILLSTKCIDALDAMQVVNPVFIRQVVPLFDARFRAERVLNPFDFEPVDDFFQEAVAVQAVIFVHDGLLWL